MKTLLANRTALNLIVISGLLALWGVVTATYDAKNLWFAGIDEVFVSILDIIGQNQIDLYATFILIGKSSLITIILGVFFGFFVGYFGKVYTGSSWLLDFWRSIPPIVVIYILINMETGSDYKWRIWLVIFGALPIMIMQIADSIRSISKKRFETFEAAKPGALFIIRNIVLFEILPIFFSVTRTVISFSIVIIIVSEMIISPEYGIGESVNSYQTAYQIEYVYAYAILLGLIGVLLNKALRILENKVIHW